MPEITTEIRRIVLIAQDVDRLHGPFFEEGERVEAVKRACARLRIPYGQGRVNDALERIDQENRRRAPRRFERPPRIVDEVAPLRPADVAYVMARIRERLGSLPVKAMPAAKLVDPRASDRLRAARMVSNEIVQSIAQCEALEAATTTTEKPDMGKIYDHLELIGPRVLVRPLPDLQVTQGGLVLPDTGIHQQNRAIVEKVGPGDFEDAMLQPLDQHKPRARRAMTIAVGDLVLYQKFAGTWVILDEQRRLMLLEDEVQGRVPADAFSLVHHDDTEHLEGEPCLICLAPIQEAKNAAAREELDKQRAEFVASSRSAS